MRPILSVATVAVALLSFSATAHAGLSGHGGSSSGYGGGYSGGYGGGYSGGYGGGFGGGYGGGGYGGGAHYGGYDGPDDYDNPIHFPDEDCYDDPHETPKHPDGNNEVPAPAALSLNGFGLTGVAAARRRWSKK